MLDIDDNNDVTWCWKFTITLEGIASTWFHNLPSRSINSFEELHVIFENHFITTQRIDLTEVHLLGIRQGPSETLRDYLAHLGREYHQIKKPAENIVSMAFRCGLQPGTFRSDTHWDLEIFSMEDIEYWWKIYMKSKDFHNIDLPSTQHRNPVPSNHNGNKIDRNDKNDHDRNG